MRSIFIDTLGENLQIHDSTAETDYWVQIPLQGLDSPDIRMTEYQNPGEDGGRVSSQNYGSRLITLQGVVKGSTTAQYEANRRRLAAACAITRDSFGYPVAKRCRFITVGGESFFVDAYFKRPVYDYTHVTHTKFLLQISVPDSFIYAETQQSSGAIVRASGGGFILPVILPIISSAAVGGTVNVNNTGSGYSFPTISLTGPLTNPYMYNATEGKSMQLTYVIGSGDVVTIDMKQHTIMLNGTSTILSTKTSDSDWWALASGINQINFSTGSSSDTGNMEIRHYNSYISI